MVLEVGILREGPSLSTPTHSPPPLSLEVGGIGM